MTIPLKYGIQLAIRLLSSSYTNHGPIEIKSNDDFFALGLPGSGTKADPFRISDLSISTEYTCINISNVDAFFTISNCSLFFNGVPETGVQME
jgi:hypothetical protein